MGRIQTFFREYWRNGKMVGSMFPSSRYLQNRMLKRLDLNDSNCIVELGPGEGCITKAILNQLGPEGRLIVIEKHKLFIEKFLQFQDPRIEVIHGSAEDLPIILEQLGISKCEGVVSSLPLTNFPRETREKVIDAVIPVLSPQGIFMQYQYSTVAYRMLKRKFGRVVLGYAPFNLPPAFVYSCYV